MPETPDGIQIVPTGQAQPNPDDIEQTLRARLPLFENPRKADYLAYRACGFSIRESAALAHVKQHTISDWRREDPVFAEWEGQRLTHLQTNLVSIVAQAKFMRCMMLTMIIDDKVLQKAAFGGLKDLSERQFEYLSKVSSKQYGPQALLALERACGEAPSEGDTNISVEKAVIIVDGREVTAAEAKQAAAAKLLRQFTANRSKFVPDDDQSDEVVEGELADGNGN